MREEEKERERGGGEGNESDLIGVALSGPVSKMQAHLCVAKAKKIAKKQSQQKQPNNRTGMPKRFPNKKSAAFYPSQKTKPPPPPCRPLLSLPLVRSSTHSVRTQPEPNSPRGALPGTPHRLRRKTDPLGKGDEIHQRMKKKRNRI